MKNLTEEEIKYRKIDVVLLRSHEEMAKDLLQLISLYFSEENLSKFCSPSSSCRPWNEKRNWNNEKGKEKESNGSPPSFPSCSPTSSIPMSTFDATIICKSGKEYKVNKCILSFRSSYFFARFSSQMADSEKIFFPDIEDRFFLSVLFFIYCDEICWDLAKNECVESLVLASRFGVERMVSMLEIEILLYLKIRVKEEEERRTGGEDERRGGKKGRREKGKEKENVEGELVFLLIQLYVLAERHFFKKLMNTMELYLSSPLFSSCCQDEGLSAEFNLIGQQARKRIRGKTKSRDEKGVQEKRESRSRFMCRNEKCNKRRDFGCIHYRCKRCCDKYLFGQNPKTCRLHFLGKRFMGKRRMNAISD